MDVPASTRLILWQINGTAPEEAALENEEHTTSNGTYIGSIPKVLNARQSRDTFFVEELDGPSAVWGAIHANKNVIVW